MPTIPTGQSSQQKQYIDIYANPPKTQDQLDEEFFNSLEGEPVKQEEQPKPQEMPIEQQNIKRKEWLDAGFSNEEIDQHLGIQRPSFMDSFKEGLTNSLAVQYGETAATMATGGAAWTIGKIAGALTSLGYGAIQNNMDEGVKYGKQVEDKINQLLTYAPKNENAKQTVEIISNVLDKTVGAVGRESGDMMAEVFKHSQLAPWIRYVTEAGTEGLLFGMLPKIGREGKALLTPKEKANIVVDNILNDKSPEQAIAEHTVNQYKSSYPESNPGEFFSKSAEESFKVLEEGHKQKQAEAIKKAREESIKKLTSESGLSAEESAKAFDSVNSILQELEIINAKEKGKSVDNIASHREPTSTPPTKAPSPKSPEMKVDMQFYAEKIGKKKWDELTNEDMKGFYDWIDKGRPSKRFISDEAFKEAQKRFNSKSNTLRTGLDPEMIKDAIIVGAYHLESGIRDFKAWSELMIKQHGDAIKEHLQEIWDKANIYLKDEIFAKTSQRLYDEAKESETKPRKFLQTVAESKSTKEPVVEGVMQIEPQDYTVQPNAESLSKAEKRISENPTEAENYVKSDTPVNAEKGATFISLIEKAQNEKNYDKAVELVEEYDRQLREAGRFVQAASIWDRLKPEGMVKWAEKQIEKVNNKKNILDSIFGGKKVELTKEEKAFIMSEMDRINKIPEGIDKSNAMLNLIDTIAKKVPPSISELIDMYRYQNMLSGWQTQERNIGENILNTVITRPYVIGTRNMIDFVESTLLGKERQTYINEVPLYYKHVINAVPNAIEAFKAAWKMEGNASTVKPELGLDYKTPFEQARMRQAPQYLTVVQRFMEASDKFNSTLISAGEYAVQLQRGKSEGEALASSKALAEKYLYRNKQSLTDADLSGISKVLADVDKLITSSRNLPVLGPAMKVMIPFIRTPMNRAIQMVELSPLGTLRKSGWTQETRARITAGSIITTIGAIEAMNNNTTWVSPSDPKEKELFYSTGRKPFSVKLNGRWIPIWYTGPFALAFALPTAVKYYTTEQKAALSEGSIEKLVDIASGTARFIGSQSSTQSIGAFFNILSGDVSNNFSNQMGFTAEQMIPLSGLLRNTNKILDPVMRHPEGFWESIKKDMPMLSQDIPAYKDLMGEESPREPLQALLPYETSQENTDFELEYQAIKNQSQLSNLTNSFNKKVERGTATDKDWEEYLQKILNFDFK
jgi:hypothetical protein